jgi:hypothetical protein
MNVKQLLDRIADHKYPKNVSLNIAFKCEMYTALVQRLEQNAFDAVTMLAVADDVAVDFLSGPGGLTHTKHEALDLVNQLQ